MLDPAILADVNRALKMKARREARLRAPEPIRTDVSPQSFFSSSSSQGRAPASPRANTALLPTNRTDTGKDFVATLDASVPHPMPRSLDDGATLDWSGKEVAEEPKHEKKWPLSMNKHKAKDKAVTTSVFDPSSPGISPDSDYDGSFRPYIPQLYLLTPYT